MKTKTGKLPSEGAKQKERHTFVTVQGQLVTVMTSPLVAGYSQSLNVSVVALSHLVVSSWTTTTAVTVALKYAQVPFAMPAAADMAAGYAAAETGLTVETAADGAVLGDEIAATEVAAEVVATLVEEEADAPRTPAANRPTMARLFILEYISFVG